MDLKLLSSFGDQTPASRLKDDDFIEALSFSHCDKYIATGDHGGRVNIYKVKQGEKSANTSISFVTKSQVFMSHFEGERSTVANPKIYCLRWIPKIAKNPLFLACNCIFIFIMILTHSLYNKITKVKREPFDIME